MHAGNANTVKTGKSLYLHWKGISLDPNSCIEHFGMATQSNAIDIANMTAIFVGKCRGDDEFFLYVNGSSREDCILKHLNYYKNSDEKPISVSGNFIVDLVNVKMIPPEIDLAKLVNMELDVKAFQVKNRGKVDNYPDPIPF